MINLTPCRFLLPSPAVREPVIHSLSARFAEDVSRLCFCVVYSTCGLNTCCCRRCRASGEVCWSAASCCSSCILCPSSSSAATCADPTNMHKTITYYMHGIIELCASQYHTCMMLCIMHSVKLPGRPCLINSQQRSLTTHCGTDWHCLGPCSLSNNTISCPGSGQR